MVVEMPRTKAPTGKRSGRKKNNIPSLESLSAQVDKEKNVVDGAVAVGTSATAERCNGSLVLYTGHGNLQTIFADSYVEHVNLAHVDGGRKKDLKALEPKSESMEIFLRVRPFLQSEVRRGEDLSCFSILPEKKGIAFNPPTTSQLYRRFMNSQDGKVCHEFTRVLSDNLTQQEVFELTMRKPIQQFLLGTSQLIFTYGVTNAGKTYTLLGPRGDRGILPRSLERIFAAVGHDVSKDVTAQPTRYEDVITLDSAAQKEALSRRDFYLAQKVWKLPKAPDIAPNSTRTPSQPAESVDSHGFFDYRPPSRNDETIIHDRDCVDDEASYVFWVSYIEIYEDTMYDLLDLSFPKGGRVLRSKTLKLCDELDTCYPKGVIEVPVFSASDAYHILGVGRKNLHVASTSLNQTSSRSHSVFSVRMVKIKGHEASVTQLNFCDLAGTERVARTDNAGARLKESQNINRDLHHLKECMEALRKTSFTKTGKRKGMIPYRNCKLTRMFRSFFSGKGRASMIVNISQCASDFDETVQAIRFASSAMRVMIPMTRRESMLIQPPKFDGTFGSAVQNVVSVQLSSSLESINELDEDAESDLENDEPSTLKKQPGRPRLPVSSVTVKKNSRKGKTDEKKEAPVSRSGCRSRDRARKTSLENTVLTAKNDYRRTFQVAVTSASRLPRVAQEDEEVSDSSAASASVDEGEDEEEKEDGEEDVSELDVTINSAVSGSVPITDDMWQEVCPFDEFIHETDRRIRALLLLIDDLQTTVKTLKAQNCDKEMTVRRELCNYYELAEKKLKREFAAQTKDKQKQWEEDLQRQLQYQKDGLERMFAARGDPSLLRFEKAESEALYEVETEEMDDYISRLEQENLDMKEELAAMKKRFGEAEETEETELAG